MSSDDENIRENIEVRPPANDHDSSSSSSPAQISLQDIRDNEVAPVTRASYKGDILELLLWAKSNQPNWLTETFLRAFAVEIDHCQGMTARQQHSRFRQFIGTKLKECETIPFLEVGNVTPDSYMNFITTLRHRKTGMRLSKSAYGNRRSALFHLFQYHPGLDGYPNAAFEACLGRHFKGFYRILTQNIQAGEGDASEGKEPMSHELYIALCEWSLRKGTIEGFWFHLFLVLTWNLYVSCI